MKKNMQYITHFTEKMKNYCAREERAKSDVIRKMDLLGLSNENQQYIIDVLLNENYLNEKRFSQSFCRGKFKTKNWGKRKIIYALKKKCIAENYIEQGIQSISEKEYLEVLDKLFNQKKRKTLDTNIFIRKKKIANFLIQRGFESSLVWEKMKELHN